MDELPSVANLEQFQDGGVAVGLGGTFSENFCNLAFNCVHF